jgi:NADH-quinone oxidoreductase subunit G
MAKITVDGAELEVPDNSMLLPVLLDRGLQIPHYCYHPKLSIDGSCRMCLVKVEGCRSSPSRATRRYVTAWSSTHAVPRSPRPGKASSSSYW